MHNESFSIEQWRSGGGWRKGKKDLKTKQWRKYEPNGEFAREPVERVAPYLYKYDAVISNSMVEFAPKSLSVALIIEISSFIPDFLLTPA